MFVRPCSESTPAERRAGAEWSEHDRAPMNVRGASGIGILCAAVTASQASTAITALYAQPAPQTAVNVPGSATGDWSGWYAGAQVGYDRGNANAIVKPATGSTNTFGRLDGGLHLGFNDFPSSRLILGTEADISFPDFFEDGAVFSRGTPRGDTITEHIDFASTLRGRLGYASNRWLIYGTGGVAASQVRFIESAARTNPMDHILRFHAGWTLGAGVEFALAPDWSARVEYRYDGLGRTGVIFPSGTGVESKLDAQGLRLGLSRTLSWPRSHRPSRASNTPPPAEHDRWNIHAQDTFVEQGYFHFRSPYEGTNSLTGASQAKNTESATAFLGVRLWPGGELYFNPEIDQGFGLNDTHGVSAFPNGEAQKASFPMARLVVDRLFVRQTFGLGGEREIVADGPNQLDGHPDISRVTLVAGRLAVTDDFDANAYANDPRTNFLNWNIYGAGAYDWTMDQLSWTWGALAELNQKRWAFRSGYFLLPTVSSVNTFDMHIPTRGEYTAEFEWRYSLFSQPGKLRVFGWVNHGTMGAYSAALALPATTPNYPDITLTREVRTNPGVVINAEQAITPNIGLFSRVSWNGGRDEILGGTDCSESWSLGGLLQGRLWGRPSDAVGFGGVVGGLSPVARAYFAAGGLGILIGDGRLEYRTERAVEAYYAYAPWKWATLSLDYQFVVNPGYNAARGPVPIYAVRVHAAF
jgi:high affinity Mn2+ porin